MAKTRGSTKWPRGEKAFRATVKKHLDTILNGRVLAIDPSSGGSSLPGWAIAAGGELESSGVIQLKTSKPVQYRLNQLTDVLRHSFHNPPPDIILVEKLRSSKAHIYVKWAAGLSVAAFPDVPFIEVPICFWKAILPDTYEKGDEEDAKAILQCVTQFAKEQE